MSCCPQGSEPLCPEDPSSAPIGKWVDYGGIRCYASGDPGHAADKLILVFHDVFGPTSGRTRQICDSLSAMRAFVVMPDAFGGARVSDSGADSQNPLRSFACFVRILRFLRRYRWRTSGASAHPTGGSMEALYGRVMSGLADLPAFKECCGGSPYAADGCGPVFAGGAAAADPAPVSTAPPGTSTARSSSSSGGDAVVPGQGVVCDAAACVCQREGCRRRRVMVVSFCWGSWAAYHVAAACAARRGEFAGWEVVGGVHFHPSLRVVRAVRRLDDRTLPQTEEAMVRAAGNGAHTLVVCANDPANLKTSGTVGAAVVDCGGRVFCVRSSHGFMNRGDLRDAVVDEDVRGGMERLSRCLQGVLG
eukprot:TRINITY_DN768_c2_g1_i1.p1 TRINITY_DN768_c2_g1~~TRINITY_DN768_c2_g1_i1.p1  ORF type:complete len:362 (-),score=25.71 TRINITY_DN768_c2_g1_i1:112-1197(-)